MLCKYLKTFEIEEETNIEKLGNNLFLDSTIENLFIPSNMKRMNSSIFNNTPNIKNVKISSNNTEFKYDEGKLLEMREDEEDKENEENKENDYNILLLCLRDAKTVTIRKHIKIIKAFSFLECSQLDTVIFEKDSSLEIIEDSSFKSSSLKSIIIPEKVKLIGNNCFSNYLLN